MKMYAVQNLKKDARVEKTKSFQNTSIPLQKVRKWLTPSELPSQSDLGPSSSEVEASILFHPEKYFQNFLQVRTSSTY